MSWFNKKISSYFITFEIEIKCKHTDSQLDITKIARGFTICGFSMKWNDMRWVFKWIVKQVVSWTDDIDNKLKKKKRNNDN